jgi:hypothetical protein
LKQPARIKFTFGTFKYEFECRTMSGNLIHKKHAHLLGVFLHRGLGHFNAAGTIPSACSFAIL